MVELKENVVYFLVGIKPFEISVYMSTKKSKLLQNPAIDFSITKEDKPQRSLVLSSLFGTNLKFHHSLL